MGAIGDIIKRATSSEERIEEHYKNAIYNGIEQTKVLASRKYVNYYFDIITNGKFPYANIGRIKYSSNGNTYAQPFAVVRFDNNSDYIYGVHDGHVYNVDELTDIMLELFKEHEYDR